jgi:glutamate synthase (ferredoxin)
VKPHPTSPLTDDLDLLSNQAVQRAIEENNSIVTAALKEKESIQAENVYRSTGARLAGSIAAKYGNRGFKGGLSFHVTGYVGQSFGAFNVQGMNWLVEGEANDYVGKSMNGGEIILRPSSTFEKKQAALDRYVGENIILGNTALYGATGGKVFAYGGAGERFGVRNSGAEAVVESVGDHVCEYMTGGVIVCLGKTGKNIGAGMTGGLAFFYDENHSTKPEIFERRVNQEIVKIQSVTSKEGESYLRSLIEEYAEKTKSKKATKILENWTESLPRFRQLVPPAEKNNDYVINNDKKEKENKSASEEQGKKQLTNA